jgi:hypothetical protein
MRRRLSAMSAESSRCWLAGRHRALTWWRHTAFADLQGPAVPACGGMEDVLQLVVGAGGTAVVAETFVDFQRPAVPALRGVEVVLLLGDPAELDVLVSQLPRNAGQAATSASFPRLRGALSAVQFRSWAPSKANKIYSLARITARSHKAAFRAGLSLGCRAQDFEPSSDLSR